MSNINIGLVIAVIGGLLLGALLVRYYTAKDTPQNLNGMIETLSEIGPGMNQGITKADLLESFSEEQYIGDFPSLLLYKYGGEIEHEPWGVRISDQVWNFDFEYINGDGDYVDIVEKMAGVAGVFDQLHDAIDKVDFNKPKAVLSYKLGDQAFTFAPEINNDWADPEVIHKIAKSIEMVTKPNQMFWYVDNGQGLILMVLTNEQANALNRLQKGLVKRLS